METLIRNLSIIAYYLSEYDMRAVETLGYPNRSVAFSEISTVMGKPDNYLKRRRDEFDVITSSHRRGQCNRPVLPAVQAIFDEFCDFTFEEITQIVKDIIAKQAPTQVFESSQDAIYLREIDNTLTPNCGQKHILNKPVPRREKTATEKYTYWRDPVVAANALCNANYKCEICTTHPTFIRRSNGKPYTEPHHLVPMSAQKDFSVSLDVENNVVSLCSNCHNQIHYGTDIDSILKPLYEQRIESLKLVGIEITYNEIKKYYRVTK